jgi:hypothetical protein
VSGPWFSFVALILLGLHSLVFLGCGFAVGAVVGVARQIFAVSPYRGSVSKPPAFVDGGAQSLAV